VMHSPYRFLLAAGLIAAMLCLFPVQVDAPGERAKARTAHTQPAETAQPETAGLQEAPVHADLSERTDKACFLHRTMYYAPCGHSVQRREPLPARLCGLSRSALESEIGSVIPGAAVTGFSASEVDISLSMPVPCPLHWVLRSGEDGMLAVLQNRMGESLETVRKTDVPLSQAGETAREELMEGKIFDDVQALEGYLESLVS